MIMLREVTITVRGLPEKPLRLYEQMISRGFSLTNQSFNGQLTIKAIKAGEERGRESYDDTKK